MTFLPQSEFGIEKSERESNPMPYPEWEYLSRLTFLVILTTLNKKSLRVELAFKSSSKEV